jgi:hypothetical protein
MLPFMSFSRILLWTMQIIASLSRLPLSRTMPIRIVFSEEKARCMGEVAGKYHFLSVCYQKPPAPLARAVADH